jgi:glycosyltransferase involved in cell wall biosynthesis
MMPPVLSILIPTRNRAQYVSHAIQSALKIDSDAIEIIVSENHGQDNGYEVCKGFKDDRLRVVRPESPLPMHENFELLLKLSTGQWVTFIGDDDAIMPHALDHLNYLVAKHPQAEAIYSARAYYFWKGMNEEYGPTCISFDFGTFEAWQDSKKQLNRTLNGEVDYIQLPQMYSGGFHRRSLLNRVLRSQQGVYFKSVTPDAYSALMACVHTYRYLETAVPMTWVGSSPHRAIASGQTHHKDREKDFLGMHSDDRLTFHQAIGPKPPINFRLFFFESYISAIPVAGSHYLSRENVRRVFLDVSKSMKHAGVPESDIEKFSQNLGFGANDSESLASKLLMAPRRIQFAVARALRMKAAKLNGIAKKRKMKDVSTYSSSDYTAHPSILSADSLLSSAYERFKRTRGLR